MFKLPPIDFHLPITSNSHLTSPPVQNLVFHDDEASTKIVYTGGSGDSALESSLAHIASPSPFIKINPDDEILMPDPEYRMSPSVQINQAISNLCRLILEPAMVGIDYADITTILSHSGQGASVFGHSSHSASQAAYKSFKSLVEMTPPTRLRISSMLAIMRGYDFDLEDFSSVEDVVSAIPLLDDDTDVIIGVISDKRMNDNIEVNIMAIWQEW
ncbi:hypothetical protein [Alcanivorax sp.]|jgi:hypothetical protein|uniref:hypothetical protein n=1 Tax=Alcanivorax sp. TaxID=1872427 RepID=UPI0032D8DA22